MKKLVQNLAIGAAIIGFSLSCNNDDDPQPISPFSDLGDFTTTAISSNIPRIEITVDGSEVNAFVSVTDQNGDPLENFTIGNYQVQEVIGSDTIQVNAELLENNVNDLPLAISANMDYSGSMSSIDITNMEEALSTFINIKNPNDQLSIVKFGASVERVQGFTTDADLLLSAVDQVAFVGPSTAFYSACQLGLDDLEGIPNTFIPLIIGFTDGIDNSSDLSLSTLISNALEANIPIYTVGLGDANVASLQTLSNATGGRFNYATNSSDIQLLYEQISNQLNNLYEIQWNITADTGTVVTVLITVEYTSGNGTFVDEAINTYVIL